MQMFMKFVNFYKKFIVNYNRINIALSDLLKKEKKEKFHIKFVFIDEVKQVFEILKKVFTSISMLIHFDAIKKIMMKTNASKFAIFEILFQFVKKTK